MASRIGKNVRSVKDRFCWPSMQKNVRNHVQNCERCLKFKAKPERAELQPIRIMHPLQ